MNLILSCESKQKNPRSSESIIDANDTLDGFKLSFEKKLKEKPKIFLKFWSGMSFKEYQKVVTILIEKKILFGIESYMPSQNSTDYKYYTEIKFKASENCYLDFHGNFNNNKLSSIELYDISCLYPLYKDKYNIPPLKYKLLIENEYIENNPNYDPIYYYEDVNKNNIKLPDAFYDTRISLEKGRITKNNKFKNKEKTSLLDKSPLVVMKDSIVILFKHSKMEYKTESYSLDESEKLNNYWKTDEGRNNLFNESRFIVTNSVLRTVSIGATYPISVIYMSKTEYNHQLNNIQKDKIKFLEDEKRKKEEIKKTLDEI